MDMFHVQEKRCNSIRNRILSQSLSLILPTFNHIFRIKLNWLIFKFSPGNSFQTPWSLRQIGIPLNPIKTIKMRDVGTEIFTRSIVYTHFSHKFHVIHFTSCLDEGIIKPITIKTCYDSWLITLNKFYKFFEGLSFRLYIIHMNITSILGFTFRFILKIIDIMMTKISIDDEECLTLKHQWNHHDDIFLFLWEFERVLWCFDIISKNLQIRNRFLLALL